MTLSSRCISVCSFSAAPTFATGSSFFNAAAAAAAAVADVENGAESEAECEAE